MESAIIIKALYVTLGAIVGFIYGKQKSDGLEKQIYKHVMANREVMIIVEDQAIRYVREGNKLRIESGTIQMAEKEDKP